MPGSPAPSPRGFAFARCARCSPYSPPRPPLDWLQQVAVLRTVTIWAVEAAILAGGPWGGGVAGGQFSVLRCAVPIKPPWSLLALLLAWMQHHHRTFCFHFCYARLCYFTFSSEPRRVCRVYILLWRRRGAMYVTKKGGLRTTHRPSVKCS